MLRTVRCCPSPSVVGAELKLGQKIHRKMVPKWWAGRQNERKEVTSPQGTSCVTALKSPTLSSLSFLICKVGIVIPKVGIVIPL